MELVARKADLVRELQFFQQIVERKNTIPILANVLIDTDGNEITLLATDLEVDAASSCEAAVDRPGAVTLPAKKLYEVVRALPDGDVKLRHRKGRHAASRSRRERFESRMPTLPREDFPTPPTSELANATVIAAAALRADDRQDAVCHHRRGHPLLPQRRAVRRQARRDDAGGHRRSSPGAGHARPRPAARATRSRPSCRARRCRSSAGCSPTATRTSSSSAARTTCSSRSGRGC